MPQLSPQIPGPSVEPSRISSASEASATDLNKPEVNIFAVRMVDNNKASVPLSDIVFDTLWAQPGPLYTV